MYAMWTYLNAVAPMHGPLSLWHFFFLLGGGGGGGDKKGILDLKAPSPVMHAVQSPQV